MKPLLASQFVATLFLVGLLPDSSALAQPWPKQFGTARFDGSNGVATDASGDVYIAGFTNGEMPGCSSRGDWDAWLAECDTDGNDKPIKQFGSSTEDAAYGIATDVGGKIYITGYTYGVMEPNGSNSGLADVWLRKYGEFGEEWKKQFGDMGNDCSCDAFAPVRTHVNKPL